MCKVYRKVLQGKRICSFRFIVLCATVILKTRILGLCSISLCPRELVLSVLQTGFPSSGSVAGAVWSPPPLNKEAFVGVRQSQEPSLGFPWTLQSLSAGASQPVGWTGSIVKAYNGFWSSAEWIPGLVWDSEMPPKDEGGGFSTESPFPHFYLKSRPGRNASLSPRINAPVLSVRHVTQLGYLLGFFEITFDFKELRIMEAAKTQVKDNLLKHVEFFKLN